MPTPSWRSTRIPPLRRACHTRAVSSRPVGLELLLVLNLSVDPPPAFPALPFPLLSDCEQCFRAYAVACATGAYLAVADSTHHLDDR